MPKAPVKKRRPTKCKTCGQTIRVPEGWSVGPAVRKHYWAKHRDIMQPQGGAQR